MESYPLTRYLRSGDVTNDGKFELVPLCSNSEQKKKKYYTTPPSTIYIKMSAIPVLKL